MRCVNCWPAAICLLVSMATVTLAEEDQVFLRRGGVVRGTVTATSPSEVTMTVGDQPRTITLPEIRLLSFGDEPAALREARSRAVSGKYSQAQQDLQRVDDATLTRAMIRNDFAFYRALVDARLALSSGGDKAAASKAMLAFVRSDPTSHHFVEAAEVLGDLAVSEGDFASAARYYGSITSRAKSPEAKMRAMLLEARALVDQGDVAGAKAKYEAANITRATTKEGARLKLFATIGRARCIAETGDQNAGVELIQKIIQDHESSDAKLFGVAYNALGDCYRAAGKSKDALMAYLHVDVLFYAEPEIHAESLHWIAKLWKEMGKTDRAAAAQTLLNRRYGGSRWTIQ